MRLRKRVLVVGRGTAWLRSLAVNLANGRSRDVTVAGSPAKALALAADVRPEIALIGASCVLTEGMNLKDAILNVSPATRVIIAKD